MKKAALIFLSLSVFFGCWYFFFLDHPSLSAKGCYARIPVEFTKGNPLIEVEIEEKKYTVKLDLGAACQFAFFNEALDAIAEKKLLNPMITTDIKGNQYKVSSYSVPRVKTKNLNYEHAVILEESKDFVTKGSVLWQLDDKKSSQIPFAGRIGRDCFTSNNLFIDLPNSMIFVTSGLDQLKMDHWPICDLFEAPFEMGQWGIVLSVETDIGVKRFILDTGASVSILRGADDGITVPRRNFNTTKFAIGDHDFGPFDLFVFPATSSMDADGLLGLDFIKKHAIYLDFKNNKALIGPSSEICGFFNKGSKAVQIPLEFTPEFPIMKVKIEGKTHSLALDLGSSCEFALTGDVLKTISKKERVGTHTTIDVDGQIHTAPKYLLQRIRIQNSEVIHTTVEEDYESVRDDLSGRVGRNILQTCNLLLDFPHSVLFLAKNFEELKSKNYSIKDFQEIPFTLTRWGAVFTVKTDFGSNRLFINTAAPFSSIRGAQEKTQIEKISTSQFKIGNVDLGSTELNMVNLPPSLDDIDGYLGMDFFHKNVVFLDFQKSRALIRPAEY